MSDKRLILILGDQLSREMSSLTGARKTKDIIVMGELRDEAFYVKHHKKKIAFIFSAMRHFAQALRDDGYKVEYQKYDNDNSASSFTALIEKATKDHSPGRIIVTEPGEHRLMKVMRGWEDQFNLPVEIREDDRFIANHKEFNDWAASRKTLRMEYFYREMRKKTGFLMDGDDPVGGAWNYDKENRKAAKSDLFMPDVPRVAPDDITKDVLTLVEKQFGDRFGDLEPFWFAVTREGALKALNHFIKEALPAFGDYQDAMLLGEKFLYHSVLSLYINAGLLNPYEVCERAVHAYENNGAPLNAVEGFVRQIIGWREYMRGVYWHGGDDYVRQNFFGAKRSLPEFYWSGETRMACVKAAVDQTREEAYAHHIQRLMVTGTFAMLAGIDPHDVHEWYLAVYADAYEWVEAPNVIGMSQYADGGALASKPYAASGAYINRMSDYCKSCHYAVSKKTEEGACPFNALYWDFLARHKDKLKNNPRLGQMYKNWERMDKSKKLAYRARAGALLKRLEKGETL
ncbi:MAG: cryptochrome/photolyase family protein [Pseudomonadota bacterium]